MHAKSIAKRAYRAVRLAPSQTLVAGRSLLGGRQVLVACFPKSGSTYITTKLAALPGWRRASLVPAYDRRDQELEESAIRRSLLHPLRPAGSIVAQHHCRASEHSLSLINKYDFRVVVLLRSLMDLTLSISDHWDRESVVGPTAYLNPVLLTQADSAGVSRLQFITRHALPWYISFYLSWLHHHHQVKRGVMFMTYERFFADKVAGMAEILDAAKIDCPPALIEQVLAREDQTRLNKGVSGRGAIAFRNDPSAYRDLLGLLACYPQVDFSPIFQPLEGI